MWSIGRYTQAGFELAITKPTVHRKDCSLSFIYRQQEPNFFFFKSKSFNTYDLSTKWDLCFCSKPEAIARIFMSF